MHGSDPVDNLRNKFNFFIFFYDAISSYFFFFEIFSENVEATHQQRNMKYNMTLRSPKTIKWIFYAHIFEHDMELTINYLIFMFIF